MDDLEFNERGIAYVVDENPDVLTFNPDIVYRGHWLDLTKITMREHKIISDGQKCELYLVSAFPDPKKVQPNYWYDVEIRHPNSKKPVKARLKASVSIEIEYI